MRERSNESEVAVFAGWVATAKAASAQIAESHIDDIVLQHPDAELH